MSDSLNNKELVAVGHHLAGKGVRKASLMLRSVCSGAEYGKYMFEVFNYIISSYRGQRAEGRGQRAEGRGQRAVLFVTEFIHMNLNELYLF